MTRHDASEREADRVADQVLGEPAAHSPNKGAVKVRGDAGQAPERSGRAPGSANRAVAGHGRPLDAPLRLDMQRRFGHDFSRVRVHVDDAAAQSARELNATAFTFGQHIAFGAGRFAPATRDGRRLLAHELTHTVQQRAGSERVQRQVDLNDFEGGDFPDRDLDAYLAKVGPDVEGTNESDDKARTIVRRILQGKRQPPGAGKLVLMVREMQTGDTHDDDERAILNILLACERNLPGWPGLSELFGAGGLSPETLFSDIDGAEEEVLLSFFDRNFVGGRKVAEDGTRKLKTKPKATPEATGSAGSPTTMPQSDAESEAWLARADRMKMSLGAEADAAARNIKKKEVIDFADALTRSLVASKAAAGANPARLDNIREALQKLIEGLGTNEVAALDTIAKIAADSNDAKVREIAITSLAKDESGVGGQQRFLRRVATAVGRELPAGTPKNSRAWLEANTEKIAEVLAEIDRVGIQGKGGAGLTPRSIELANKLLDEYTDHVDDAPFNEKGGLGGVNVNASNKIELDCDGYASYGARLLRPQGWQTVGYMGLFPRENKPGTTVLRDAHAVALASKGKEFLGVSNADIRELGGTGAKLTLEEAKDALWSLALELYGKISHYDLYFVDAKEGGAYDRRLLNPVANSLPIYKKVG